jgi:soluble lytic murein transglycosylase-like protein
MAFAALALAAISSFDAGGGYAGAAMTVCEREMIAAASAEKVPLGVLYAVALTETEHEKSLQPYALNIEGRTYFDDSAANAVRRFNFARAQGAKLIDVGCMQINYHYHGEHFRSVEEMLEPHRNVNYAAKFLKQLRAREGNWTMAVARYHAGPDNDPAQKRYVCSVIRKMVKTGFGAWTANARRFCG